MSLQEESATNWKALYLELVKSLEFTLHQNEKRAHSRLVIPHEIELAVQIASEEYKVIDISPGGISFTSDHPFSGGDEVSIVYGTKFKLASDIVYCRVEKVESSGEEDRYRVGARFLKEGEGYRIMVMVLEFYSTQLGVQSD